MHIYTSTIQHTLMHSVVVVQVAAARDRKRPDASAGPLFPNRPPKPELAKEEDDLGEGDVANVLRMQRQARQEAKAKIKAEAASNEGRARGRGRGKGRGRGGRGRGKATAEQPMPAEKEEHDEELKPAKAEQELLSAKVEQGDQDEPMSMAAKVVAPKAKAKRAAAKRKGQSDEGAAPNQDTAKDKPAKAPKVARSLEDWGIFVRRVCTTCIVSWNILFFFFISLYICTYVNAYKN